MTHVSPVLYVDGAPKSESPHQHGTDPGVGMTGMVIGVTIDGPDSTDAWPAEPADPRKLTLVMQEQPNAFGDTPAMAFAMVDGNQDGVPRVPGPTLVLTRGEPVEITLVNRLREATAIHWHGMELESYYDGVHGWGRTGQRVTPMIEPGGSFVVRFTPPRSGTFMYHTHLHDRRQLTSGLYGALVVVDAGEVFDDTVDHAFVIGRGGPQQAAPVVLNNSREPEVVWKAGTRHRVRLINITPDDIVSVTLQGSEGTVRWRVLTKDGAPAAASGEVVAASQVIAVGETYDFEYVAPAGRRTLWLEVRTGGRWLVQGKIIVR
jgi:manganese oxidase